MEKVEKTILEQIAPELQYVQNGDYRIPNIIDSSKEGKKLNRWGHQYAEYFRGILKGGPYDYALMEGVLNQRCYEVGERAEEMYQSIHGRMCQEEKIEEIKKTDYRRAVALLEKIQAEAEEVVLQEVVYDDDLEWLPEE